MKYFMKYFIAKNMFITISIWWSPIQVLTGLDVAYFSDRVTEQALVATADLTFREIGTQLAQPQTSIVGTHKGHTPAHVTC